MEVSNIVILIVIMVGLLSNQKSERYIECKTNTNIVKDDRCGSALNLIRNF